MRIYTAITWFSILIIIGEGLVFSEFEFDPIGGNAGTVLGESTDRVVEEVAVNHYPASYYFQEEVTVEIPRMGEEDAIVRALRRGDGAVKEVEEAPVEETIQNPEEAVVVEQEQDTAQDNGDLPSAVVPSPANRVDDEQKEDATIETPIEQIEEPITASPTESLLTEPSVEPILPFMGEEDAVADGSENSDYQRELRSILNLLNASQKNEETAVPKEEVPKDTVQSLIDKHKRFYLEELKKELQSLEEHNRLDEEG